MLLSTDKKSGESSLQVSYGLTSCPGKQAGPQRVLRVNRGHWVIESCHYMIDWNYDEDRSRIRTGHGPKNITRLRRVAIGVLKSKGRGNVAEKNATSDAQRAFGIRLPADERELLRLSPEIGAIGERLSFFLDSRLAAE